MSATPPFGDPKNSAEAMRQLRMKMLTTPPSEIGIKRSQDFPRTYGVLMDWPLQGSHVATVVGLCDGNASVYTTGTFGVIGGIGHEAVRSAANSFVKAGDALFAEAAPTSEFPYAQPRRVRFYLITFNGVRVIDADLTMVTSGKHICWPLFGEGQRVMTQLRLTTQRH